MQHHQVHFRLPDPMFKAAESLAKEADISVGQLVRTALEAEIKRRSSPAKTPNRADEQLLASLRRLLARDLAIADSWGELARRLAEKGYEFREAGGGLALHSLCEGQRLCKRSELGYAYRDFMRRFKMPFPGHSQRKLAEQVLGEEVVEPYQ